MESLIYVIKMMFSIILGFFIVHFGLVWLFGDISSIYSIVITTIIIILYTDYERKI